MMNCPNCFKPLGTSLTSCDRCGWQISPGMCVPRAEHDRLMAEARNRALEDAARMVDCGCECREAVLSAATKTERWRACGRDPCGALDAAAIRAMKG